VGKLEGLFSMQDRIDLIHKLALMLLLSLQDLSKLGGEEEMVCIGHGNVGWKLRLVPIGVIEGMAHLIGLKQDSLGLINNCMDLNSWNELYD